LRTDDPYVETEAESEFEGLGAMEVPPNPDTRNFNLNDILGDLGRDETGQLEIPEKKKDNEGNRIND